MQAIKDAGIPMAIRLATIRSIFDLYRDCFHARCTETLSHLNQTGRSALNEICYMFWDISVLGCLEGNDEERVLVDCVFSVPGDTLKILHLACQEAAIHSYGEFSLFYPRRVEEALDAFSRLRDLFRPAAGLCREREGWQHSLMRGQADPGDTSEEVCAEAFREVILEPENSVHLMSAGGHG